MSNIKCELLYTSNAALQFADSAPEQLKINVSEETLDAIRTAENILNDEPMVFSVNIAMDGACIPEWMQEFDTHYITVYRESTPVLYMQHNNANDIILEYSVELIGISREFWTGD